MTSLPRGEFELIEAIRARVSGNPGVRIGIGDDCAVLRAADSGDWLVTTDMLMDGRHFRLDECGPAGVGEKAIGVNLSDIAAMAGKPIAAFVAVALPRSAAAEIGLGLLEGMKPLADRFGVALAGGDTNAWDGPLIVCVTVMGLAGSGGPVLRSGAREGDQIYVTGALGGSLRGRHLKPRPRIDEALAISRQVPIHAMIDLSDGLASDLGHILKESGGLGATLIESAIPVHDDANWLAAKDGSAAVEHALCDGEDFELCFTIDPSDAGRLESMDLREARPVFVGTIESEPGLRLARPDGRVETLTWRGFDHLRPGD